MCNEAFAYLAGLFDGEGTVTTYVPNGHIQLKVSIANQDLGVLEWIKGIYGGSVYSNQGHCFKYDLQGLSRVKKFLLDIFPYLRIKRSRAFVALQFPTGRQGVPLTEEEQAIRLSCREQLMALTASRRSDWAERSQQWQQSR